MPVVGQRLVVAGARLNRPLLHPLLHHPGGAMGNADEGQVIGQPLQLGCLGQHAEVVGRLQRRQRLAIIARLHVHGRQLGPVLLLLREHVDQGSQHLGGWLVLLELVVGPHLEQVPGLRCLARRQPDRLIHRRDRLPVLLELHMSVGQGDVGVGVWLVILALVGKPLLHGLYRTLKVALSHIKLCQVVAHLLGHHGRQAASGDGISEVFGRLAVFLLLRGHEAQGLQDDALVIDPFADTGQSLLQLGIGLAIAFLGDQLLRLVDCPIGPIRQGRLLGGPAGGAEQHRHGDRGEDHLV